MKIGHIGICGGINKDETIGESTSSSDFQNSRAQTEVSQRQTQVQ